MECNCEFKKNIVITQNFLLKIQHFLTFLKTLNRDKHILTTIMIPRKGDRVHLVIVIEMIDR